MSRKTQFLRKQTHKKKYMFKGWPYRTQNVLKRSAFIVCDLSWPATEKLKWTQHIIKPKYLCLYFLIHRTLQTQMQTLGVGKSIMAAKTTPTLVTSWQIVIYWNVMCGKQACFYWFFWQKELPFVVEKRWPWKSHLNLFILGCFYIRYPSSTGEGGGRGANLPPFFVKLRLQLLSFYLT